MDEFENVMKNYPFSIMAKEWKPTLAHRMDRYYTPEELKQMVIKSPRIISYLEQLSMGNPVILKEVQKVVQNLIDEIGTNRSLTSIRCFGVVIEFFLKRFAILNVNAPKIQNLRMTMGRNPVVYLPTHRSYGDFTLISYMCFYYDIEIPNVAGGMDFASMKFIGEQMRKSGAFFIRRSFANDQMYWNVLREYVHSLVKHCHRGLEFFLEGTRSRSMKSLPPKVGLLSMTLEPYFMGEVVDLTFVPVSISYERPFEDKIFVDELLGIPKPKERTVNLIKSLKTLSQNHYGNIYIRVHDGISFREFVGDRVFRMKYANEPAHVQKLTKTDLTIVQDLAYHIIDLQQKFVVINIVNLIAICISYRRYLSQVPQTINELCEEVLLLSKIFERFGAITNIDPARICEDIDRILKVHSRMFEVKNDHILLKTVTIDMANITNLRFKAHRLNDGTMQQCAPIFSLQIYTNPCLYWTALPSIILVTLKRLSNNGALPINVNLLRTNVQTLRTLYEKEFVFYEKFEEREFFEKLNLLKNFNLLEFREELDEVVYKNGNSDLEKMIFATISPYFCAYYQTVSILSQYFADDEEFSESDFLVKVQMEVEFRLAHQQEFTHPYCLCLESLSNALHCLVPLNAIVKTRLPNKTTFQKNQQNLIKLSELLSSICKMMPFNYLYDYNPVASLTNKL